MGKQKKVRGGVLVRLSGNSGGSSFINGITLLKMLFQRAVYKTNYFVQIMNEIIESLQKFIGCFHNRNYIFSFNLLLIILFHQVSSF